MDINADLTVISELSSSHKLVLNGSKTKLMIFGHAELDNFVIGVGGKALESSSCERNLGIFLDSQLRFEAHISNLLQGAYYRLKVLYMHKDILTARVKLKLCDSLVLSYLSFSDVLYWPAARQRERNSLQRLQNSCLKFCYGARKYDHVTPLFEASGWLKLHERYLVHLSTLVHKIVHVGSPKYLADKLVLSATIHGRQMRKSHDLCVPRHRTTKFQSSFSYNAVKVYNDLPDDVKSPISVPILRKKLKEHVLQKRK